MELLYSPLIWWQHLCPLSYTIEGRSDLYFHRGPCYEPSETPHPLSDSGTVQKEVEKEMRKNRGRNAQTDVVKPEY
ncbi:hypothetical protein QQF64_006088 [Cirrhinus molitorella]|uniref:Uncharacterized protein n=1 Tax=Cirrhinus molitorella TaxID=172907 RepID=A0ABR3MH87_9TELE